MAGRENGFVEASGQWIDVAPLAVSGGRGLARKLKFYGRRYGFLNAMCRYPFRRLPRFWAVVGRLLSRSARKRWFRDSGRPKILNLGGGGNLLRGCLTADKDPRADVYADVTRPLEWPTGSLDGIFLEEVIEHVSVKEARALLRECARVLVPGGALRITTPDLEWFAIGVLEHREGAREDIHRVFWDHGHEHVYTEEEIVRMCSEEGFREVRRTEYRDPGSVLGRLDSHPERFGYGPERVIFLEMRSPST